MTRLIPWLLAAASGLALALALPGADLVLLLLVFPGLLLEAVERGGGRWRPFFLGWFAGLVHWLVAVNWVVPVMHHYGGLPMIAAVASLFAMALILGTCWAIAVGMSGLVSAPLRVWLFPVAYMVLDAGRQFWPLLFPWNPPAAALAQRPTLLTSLPVWGATGLGWAILACGAGLWGLLRRRTRVQGGVSVAAAVLLTVAAGVAAPPPRGDAQGLVVAAVQPGTSLEEKWDPSEWRSIEDRLWLLTERAARQGAQVVVWPESALPYRVEGDAAYRDLLVAEARRMGIRIVLNAVGGSENEGYTNSAYVVTPEGIAGPRYDKVHLVPFGEYVPWWARLAFAAPLVREVGHFVPGVHPELLPVGVPLGMAICYEVTFADLIAEEVRSGAELLATITNDGWYGYSWAPRQHFAQVVLRAAESRRWLVRSALTGISGFVDPEGRVRQRLEVGESGVLVESMQPLELVTLRSAHGDWWWALCGAATLAMLAVAGARARRTRRTLLG